MEYVGFALEFSNTLRIVQTEDCSLNGGNPDSIDSSIFLNCPDCEAMSSEAALLSRGDLVTQRLTSDSVRCSLMHDDCESPRNTARAAKRRGM